MVLGLHRPVIASDASQSWHGTDRQVRGRLDRLEGVEVTLEGPHGPVEVWLRETYSEPIFTMCRAHAPGPVRQWELIEVKDAVNAAIILIWASAALIRASAPAMLSAAGFRPEPVRLIRHSDWLRSSAKLAVRSGAAAGWQRPLLWKPAERAPSLHPLSVTMYQDSHPELAEEVAAETDQAAEDRDRYGHAERLDRSPPHRGSQRLNSHERRMPAGWQKSNARG